VKSDARSNQLITFIRFLYETLPIKYLDLSSTAPNHTRALQLPDGICYAWSLDTQHFGEQILSDPQCVLVTAVTHHEQPTRQPLLEAVRRCFKS
jgi:hypothetical protein